MNRLLIRGGTGIIGLAVAELAMQQGFKVTVTGIEDTPVVPAGAEFIPAGHSLEDCVWNVILDVCTFDTASAKLKCDHLFILSTTLVYDRSKYSVQRISPNHPKAQIGSQGGYVDHKLKIEEFWENNSDINWTILRPYHVVGRGSYLGCLPPHNRDPYLLEHIKKGEIYLCDGGRIPLNVVNPRDIGEVMIKSIGNAKTFRKAYNLVNPKEIIARDYYQKIAEILGVELKIKNLTGEKVWKSGDWKLTTLPHLYDISDLDYVPSISLEESLREAIKNHPPLINKNQTPVHCRMHAHPEPKIHQYFE